jgi:hypothetical protein
VRLVSFGSAIVSTVSFLHFGRKMYEFQIFIELYRSVRLNAGVFAVLSLYVQFCKQDVCSSFTSIYFPHFQEQKNPSSLINHKML